MAKIGVVLSGCGVYDGSEIHEAVLTLLYLSQNGAQIICMSPDKDLDVVNHLTGQPTGEKRNTLVESARIARGAIKNIKDVAASDIDGLILPGGFGAAKNLSDFAMKGKDATVDAGLKKLVLDMTKAGKPVGGICIAPATLAKAFEGKNPEVTIGNDISTSSAIEDMGGQHKNCTVDMICVDEKNNLITTPAYMLGPEIKDVAIGIEKLVSKVLAMVK